jgi:hypothetical protein
MNAITPKQAKRIENLITNGAWLASPNALLFIEHGKYIVTVSGGTLEYYRGDSLADALDVFESENTEFPGEDES